MRKPFFSAGHVVLKSAIGATLLSMTSGTGVYARKIPAQPNIVLVCADDLGWSDIGCYGSEVKTPNLDRLAESGMRFRQFHNTSKCFPSRACLLTGVYAQDCGYDVSFTSPIRNAVTLGEVLRTAGYRTLWAGKHHGAENPVTRGFDRYYGLKDGACNYFNPGKPREGEGLPAQKNPLREWCIDSVLFKPYSPPQKDFYTTDYFTNYALGWLDEYKNEQKPFFLYLAYNAPHDPLMAWPGDIEKYKGRYDAGYETIRQQRFEKQRQIGVIGENCRLSEPTHVPWESLSEDQQREEARKMEVYAAMIDRLDQNIGRILEKLQETGKDQNTLILFVSDNGASAEMVDLKNDDDSAPVGSMTRWVSLGKEWANVGNTPFRFYKNYSYQGGINTPCIAWWPSVITPGSFSNYPGHFVDFMATFVELSGAQYPTQFRGQTIVPCRGESLVPAFKGEKTSRDHPLFWEWKQGKAVRKGEWKIVRHGENIPWSLYNLQEDPAEIDDRATEKPEIVSELNQLFIQWKAGWSR